MLLILYYIFCLIKPKPKYKIIGLTGYKGSGKDTVANFLKLVGYKKYAFADTLKSACKCMFGFTNNQLYGDAKEIIDLRWNKTPREVMQKVGTDLMRSYIDNIWLLNFKFNYNGSYAVISDVRFDNEAELIKQMGGIIINIERYLQRSDSHASERGISNYNAVLYNTGGFYELYWEILKILC